MEPRDATAAVEAATSRLLGAVRKADAEGLSIRSVAKGLSVVAYRMEANYAENTATSLLRLLKDTKDSFALSSLATALSAVAGHMEPKAASTASAEAAKMLLQRMQETKDQDCFALSSLATTLSAVAGHMKPKAASTANAEAATMLLQRMKDDKKVRTLGLLSDNLAALAARMPREYRAATTAEAAEILIRVMHDMEEYDALEILGQGLSLVAGHMEPRDAEKTAMAVLQMMRLTKSPSAFRGLADAMSKLAARMPADIAGPVMAETATISIQLIRGTSDRNASSRMLLGFRSR
jgi:hypothetical protein